MAALREGSACLAAPIALGAAIQLPLAAFLGHAHDMPLFMASGYLVAHGLNPYLPVDLSAVFGSQAFNFATSIGYPPPWLLVCALAYRAASALSPSLFLYVLFLKLPLVAANIALAIAVGRGARELGADEGRSRLAVIRMLFNPLLIAATAAWGQIDGVVALCALAALVALSRGRIAVSALALALSVSIKPIALPLLPLALLAAARDSGAAGLTLPRRLRRVGPSPLCPALHRLRLGGERHHPRLERPIRGRGRHVGPLSLRAPRERLCPPVGLAFVGLLWLPALVLAFLRSEVPTLELRSLLRRGLGLELVFFLCRAWLSEPNLVDILPLVAILAAAGSLEKKVALRTWLIPAVLRPPHHLPPPAVLSRLPGDGVSSPGSRREDPRRPHPRSKPSPVIPWQMLGWRLVASCLGRGDSAQVSWAAGSPRGGAA